VATTDAGDASTTEVLRGRVDAGNDTGSVSVDAGFGTVMAPGRAPSPPVALLPAPALDGLPAKLVRMPVLVEFPPVAGAVRYRLQLAADAGFSPLIADLATESPAIELPDLPDGRYAIRVRGIDAQGLEGNDAARDFDISARPGAPRLEAPTADALADDTPPRFAWVPDGPADRLRYHFQLARDEVFTQPHTDVRDLATPEYAPTEPLPPGVWHWRVAAIDKVRGDGPFSETRVLRRPAPPPAQAAIERSPQSILVRWPAGRVHATLAPEATPQTVVAEAIVDAAPFTAPRPDPGVYVLTARTVEADGFEGPAVTTQVVHVPPPPSPPIPTTPADDALLDASPDVLMWNPGTDTAEGTTYRLQVERSSPASDTPIDRDALTDLSASPGALPPGLYRWRVAAATVADGPGSFSAWRTFRVLSAPPGTPTIRRTPDLLSMRWPDGTPLQVSLSAEGGGTIFAGPVTDGTVDLPRPAPGRYALSARTIEADGFLGRVGVTTAIDLPAPPAPPALAAGATADGKPVVDARPALQWPASAPDAEYRLQIATDAAFTAPLVDRVVGNVTTATHDTALPPGSYRWRVAAANEIDGPGPFSAPQTFRIEVPAPTLLPVSRSKGQIVARWEAEVPATSYEVQLALDAAFSTAIATRRTAARDASFTPTGPGEYFTRVRGLDADGEPGPWSNAVTVRVPAPLPWWIYPLLLFGIVLP
jgi:predicted phage tail protein